MKGEEFNLENDDDGQEVYKRDLRHSIGNVAVYICNFPYDFSYIASYE